MDSAILRRADTGESMALNINELSNIGIVFDVGESGQYEGLTFSNVTDIALDGSSLEITIKRYFDTDPDKFYALTVFEI